MLDIGILLDTIRESKSKEILYTIKAYNRTSLEAQWVGIRLLMQGTQVQSWSGKIPRAMEQLRLGVTTSDLTATATEAHTP